MTTKVKDGVAIWSRVGAARYRYNYPLHDLSLADLKVLLDYLSDMMDVYREEPDGGTYQSYENAFRKVHDEWDGRLEALGLLPNDRG